MPARTRLGAALFVASLACSTRARATEPAASELQAARELFARAEKDEDAGRWEAALSKLRQAATVKMTPGLRFHAALCEEKLGRLAAALTDYGASQTQARQEGNREVLDAVMEPLALLGARIPSLTVSVPAGARKVQVTLDGAQLPAGLWNTALPVDVGAHTVQATAANRTSFSATVSTLEHEAKIIEVRLPELTSAPVVAAPVRLPTSNLDPHRGPRKGALIATVGALALVGGGFASFLGAGTLQSDARGECAARTSCNNLKPPIQALDWVALGSWLGGAAVGSVAVILWVTPDARDAPRDQGQRGASVLLLPGSVHFQGTF